PLPAGFTARIAGALRDRADLDVAIINAPRLLRGIGVAAHSVQTKLARHQTVHTGAPKRSFFDTASRIISLSFSHCQHLGGSIWTTLKLSSNTQPMLRWAPHWKHQRKRRSLRWARRRKHQRRSLR